MTPKQVRAARALLGGVQLNWPRRRSVTDHCTTAESNAAKPRLVRWGQSESHLNSAVSNSPSARGRGLSCVGCNVDRRWHRV